MKHTIIDQQFSIRLPDGRNLAYALYGDPHGQPVFFFHGSPGSRYQGQVLHNPAVQLGLRIIAPERPGFGHSDFQPGRTIPHWPDDVRALADALMLERFSVLGASGGGPYAAACAACLPDRLTHVALVASIGPMTLPGIMADFPPRNRMFFRIARHTPWLLPALFQSVAKSAAQNPERYVQHARKTMDPIDAGVLEEENLWSWILQDLLEAYRNGVAGATWDIRLVPQPWRFSLASISAPVILWHGEQGRYAPPAMAKYLAKTIPNCQATFVPQMGHLSLFIRCADAYLQAFQ